MRRTFYALFAMQRAKSRAVSYTPYTITTEPMSESDPFDKVTSRATTAVQHTRSPVEDTTECSQAERIKDGCQQGRADKVKRSRLRIVLAVPLVTILCVFGLFALFASPPAGAQAVGDEDKEQPLAQLNGTGIDEPVNEAGVDNSSRDQSSEAHHRVGERIGDRSSIAAIEEASEIAEAGEIEEASEIAELEQVQIEVEQTVGPVTGAPNQPCPTEQEVAIAAGREVIFCYSVKNVGSVSIITHTMGDTSEGVLLDGVFTQLDPGDVAFLSRTVTITDTFTNVLTWNVIAENGTVAEGQAAVDVHVGDLGLRKLVDTQPVCRTDSDEELIVDQGTLIYYCIELTNTGSVALTRHLINDSTLGATLDISSTLAPGESLLVDNSYLSGRAVGTLGPIEALNDLTNQAQVRSSSVSLNEELTRQATATVRVPQIELVQGLIQPDVGCVGYDELIVEAGTILNRCFLVTNSGSVVLTHHYVTNNAIQLLTNHEYMLQPQEQAQITLNTRVDETTELLASWRATIDEQEDAPSSSSADALFVRVPSITLTKTVGLERDQCGTANELSIEPGTVVYYCYTVENTSDLPLPLHTIRDENLGELRANVDFNLAPGATVNSVQLGIVAASAVNETTESGGEWIAVLNNSQGQPVRAVASDSVRVNTGDTDASLSVFAFHDVNANGARDLGEPTIDGLAISLSDSNGLEQNLRTDAQGMALFTSLDAGTYQVSSESSFVFNIAGISISLVPAGPPTQDVQLLPGDSVSKRLSYESSPVTDSDNDGISDRVEGAGDLDGDGLADYLDADNNVFTPQRSLFLPFIEG